jgi:hypothetical protein
LVIHQASADVVLGFIGRTGRHPPNDDSNSIAGVAGRALSLHGIKLLRVTDRCVGCFPMVSAEVPTLVYLLCLLATHPESL